MVIVVAFIVLIILFLIVIGVFLSLKKSIANGVNPEKWDNLQVFLEARFERVERNLRQDITESSGYLRQEVTQNFNHLQELLLNQMTQLIQTQNKQSEGISTQLTALQKGLSDTLLSQFGLISESNARRMVEIRETLETQIRCLQKSNEQKLDEMRLTVDEKLQTTLQERLNTSFKQVADRLDQVHKGLGEMQSLAQGVGDLKHILTNVKTRGIFGESQLIALLEQVLTVEQYKEQVVVVPNSKEMVDAAIALPGKGQDGEVLWLPIDSKFPTEDYERVLEAQENADAQALEVACKALEARVRAEAKSISSKYIAPPYTTDFAILFLPSEGLYAEVLRRAGLVDFVQREHRVVLAGPTNLLAILSSLRMGFKSLAIEKRSSEVWQVLGAVKTEFSKFSQVLEKLKTQTTTVLNTIESAGIRSRAMTKQLKTVESLPQQKASDILGLDE